MSTQLFDAEGLATRAQLLAAGVPEHVIDNDLKAGRYASVVRGVYARGPLSPRGWLAAGLLAGGDDAALCFASALVQFGLLAKVITIDVAAPRRCRGTDRFRFHRLTLTDDEIDRRDGLRVTTIERTLLDIAATGADIRRVAHEAIAKRLTTQQKLKQMAAKHRGERGAPALRRIAGEPHTRSNLERRFLTFLNDNGFPQPSTNHAIGRYTVDAYWPQYQLVVEVDEDAHRVTFEEDRERDRFLVGMGLRVMRVTEDSLRDEIVLREEVRRAARIVR